jgi:hypothetical protein
MERKKIDQNKPLVYCDYDGSEISDGARRELCDGCPHLIKNYVEGDNED